MMEKEELEIGDLIRFHSWEVGGSLFGVIIEYEDEVYHSKLNIWHPSGIYFLKSYGIDSINVIYFSEEIYDYEQHDFKNIIKESKRNNIFMNIQYDK